MKLKIWALSHLRKSNPQKGWRFINPIKNISIRHLFPTHSKLGRALSENYRWHWDPCERSVKDLDEGDHLEFVLKQPSQLLFSTEDQFREDKSSTDWERGGLGLIQAHYMDCAVHLTSNLRWGEANKIPHWVRSRISASGSLARQTPGCVRGRLLVTTGASGLGPTKFVLFPGKEKGWGVQSPPSRILFSLTPTPLGGLRWIP